MTKKLSISTAEKPTHCCHGDIDARRLLLVDADPRALRRERDAADQCDYAVMQVDTLDLAIEAVISFRPNLVIISAILLGHDLDSSASPEQILTEIHASIARLRQTDCGLPVWVRHAGDSRSIACGIAAATLPSVKLICISPVDDAAEAGGELVARLEKIVPPSDGLRQLPSAARTAPRLTGPMLPLIGSGAAMTRVFEAIGTAAASFLPTLILGEVGTGKRTVARMIHRYAGLSEDRCLVFDAAALQSTELIGLLFADSPGEIELRESLRDLTLVLAHIEQAEPRLQAMLANVLNADAASESHSWKDLNVRLVFTALEPRRLWPDLRFRLQGETISLPALRVRSEDLELLIDRFMAENITPGPGAVQSASDISPDALRILSRYPWPGNLLELRSVVTAALRDNRGVIEADTPCIQSLSQALSQSPPPARNQHVDHPSTISDESSKTPGQIVHTRREPLISEEACGAQSRLDRLRTPDFWRDDATVYAETLSPTDKGMLLGNTIDAIEVGLITAVLDATSGNIAQSARLLGITRVSLRRKIRALKIQIPKRGAVTFPASE
ncbi:MAG: sigma 54-interacting transcriptional regulator [Planctomycetaceae bacterium]|nr:sigma 54-interacting transcriptional regulator [Planctomycetaceae bacterium]